MGRFLWRSSSVFATHVERGRPDIRAVGPVTYHSSPCFSRYFFSCSDHCFDACERVGYGPFWGTLLNIVGENIAASVAFGIGRLFGRRFVRSHEQGWVKTYDDVLRQEGFLTILFMRSLYFPSDLVNYGSGMTGILYRQYFFGTLLGLIAPIVTVTVLGDAFTNPRAFATFAALSIGTIGGAFLLRRSAWAKKRLYPDHVHENI